MREIKFRGKRTDNGKWVYGSLLIDYVTGKFFIHALGNSVNDSDKVGEEGILNFVAFEVIPETFGQYTGLKDVNGDEICEGDIVYFSVFDYNGLDTQYKGVVKFAYGRWQIWQSEGNEYYGSDGAFDLDWVVSQDDEIEIIGNVTDNPELLEVHHE